MNMQSPIVRKAAALILVYVMLVPSLVFATGSLPVGK